MQNKLKKLILMQPQTKQPLLYDYEGLPPDPISVLWRDAKSSLQGTKIITLGAFTLSQIEEAITNVVDHAIRIIFKYLNVKSLNL